MFIRLTARLHAGFEPHGAHRGDPASVAGFDEVCQLPRHGAPTVVEPKAFMLVAVGDVAVHRRGRVFGAAGVVLHDDGREERRLGWAPIDDERVREDYALECVDGEKAARDVRAEFAAVLADLIRSYLPRKSVMGCGPGSLSHRVAQDGELAGSGHARQLEAVRLDPARQQWCT